MIRSLAILDSLNKLEIIIILSLIFSGIFCFALSYYYLLFFLYLLLIYIYFWGLKSAIYPIIIGYLTLTSDINPSIRIIFNVFAFAFLMFIFLKEYGFDFSRYKKLPNKVISLGFVVLLSMAIPTIFSENISISLIEISKQILFFIICYFLYSTLKSDDDIRNLYRTLIVTGLILSVGVALQIFFGVSLFGQKGYVSLLGVSGFYENPNALGLFLITCIIVLYSYITIYKPKRFSKHFHCLTFLFLIITLLLTNSRTAIFATIISLLYYLFIFRRKLFYKIIFASFIIITLILIIPSTYKLLSLYLRFERVFDNTRQYFWDISYSIIKENWLLGIGPGMFEEYIYKFLPVKLGGFFESQIWWARNGTSHNFFLFRFTEMGLLGLFSSFYFVYIFLNLTNKVIKKTKDVYEKYYKIAVSFKAIGIGLLFRSLLESNGLITHGWITRDLPFWVVFIVLIYIHEKINVLDLKNNA